MLLSTGLLQLIGSQPHTHSSDIATGLGKFIYSVCTKTGMNVGNYVFKQTVKHAKTDVVKLPIASPTLLCNIMLDQHPNLITTIDVSKKRESPITLHYKLFRSSHVPDIVGTSGYVSAAGLMTKQEIVAALKDTCSLLYYGEVELICVCSLVNLLLDVGTLYV